MAKYNITHSCGHTATHSLFERVADRPRKIAYIETTLCTDCWQAARDAERERVAEIATTEAEAEQLPALTGSEKQIAWAMTLRKQFLDALAGAANEASEPRIWAGNHLRIALTAATGTVRSAEMNPEHVARFVDSRKTLDAAVLTLIAETILAQTEARFWIDHRGMASALSSPLELLPADIQRNAQDAVNAAVRAALTGDDASIENAAMDAKREAEDASRLAQEAKEAARTASTIRAENARTPLVAAIEIRRLFPTRVDEQSVVTVYYAEKDDTLRTIVKNMDFTWDGYWQARYPNLVTARHRGAEVAAKLLKLGFNVAVPDEDARRRALSGDYESYTRSVISVADDRFLVAWDRRDGDFYDLALRLRGGRYDRDRRAVSVPRESWEQVLDFATTHGFTTTESAQKLAELGKAAERAALTVKPSVVVVKSHSARITTQELDAPTGIPAAHLIDEDDA